MEEYKMTAKQLEQLDIVTREACIIYTTFGEFPMKAFVHEFFSSR